MTISHAGYDSFFISFSLSLVRNHLFERRRHLEAKKKLDKKVWRNDEIRDLSSFIISFSLSFFLSFFLSLKHSLAEALTRIGEEIYRMRLLTIFLTLL